MSCHIMKAPVLFILFVGSALGKSTRGTAAFTVAYSETAQNGPSKTFTDYAPDLNEYDYDNAIKSVYQTGMWVYYENVQYNQQPGRVHWVHGIEISADFPSDYSYMASSLKFVGSPDTMDADGFTVFEGTAFTGSEFYSESDAADLGPLTRHGSSIVITGTSPWTFYSDNSWSGRHMCLFPNIHDEGANGEVLNFGLFPNVEDIGIMDNSIGSVRKGCWIPSEVESKPLEAEQLKAEQLKAEQLKAEQLKAEYRGKNGAWGILEP
ncbi:uncharacterized protein LOC125031811 [Penaeus chinensis]|uniref:uncharacterized protein LOC125031811 n=1 Tax=Penaeus chinensis TaxID=139456 RepID=UPI001FB7A8E6|nr:uncharacterized protein LOC125031811 [Penaeus chinensis]